MPPVFTSAYLPPVASVLEMAGASEVLIEQYDSYRKQTFRNRCVIAVADGTQTLSVPVEKGKPGQLMRDVRISGHGNWRHLHWNAISSAYMNSPFFLYYEDDFRAVYEKNHEFLIDFNLELLELVAGLIGLRMEFSFTEHFVNPAEMAASGSDFRWMDDPGTMRHIRMKPYYQVFEDRNGFIPNLSIADLLFNMGPESLLYLKNSQTF